MKPAVFSLGLADLRGEFAEPSLDALPERSPCLRVKFGAVLIGVLQLFEQLALPSLQGVDVLLKIPPAAPVFLVAVAAVRAG
ncbi:hypothetical protein [Actinocrispum wychmicini]|uniref:hypothetical protein n=1 Tax=Actinocrispum wychmicini TaxID=1213861 RepID=UPI001FB83854|nr:hypothetical protein [Actinocrispum wychmicini]